MLKNPNSFYLIFEKNGQSAREKIMEKIYAAITAVGGYVPEYKLTNSELEKMVDTNDEWIKTRTGIDERRILKGEGLGSSDMGAEAVKELLAKRKIGPEEIDCVICATVTPDMVFPATANIISDKTGMTNAFGFDVEAACSGFLYSLTVGASLIESGRYKKVVVVGSDKNEQYR
jgi:3-oxoacyl-[acyl-carrier-protein] synthase-3